MNMKEEVVYHYYNIKDKIKKATDKITQRTGAEDNKIKFRETFVTKCKRAYRSILTKYYIKKEANILAKKEEYPEERVFDNYRVYCSDEEVIFIEELGEKK